MLSQNPKTESEIDALINAQLKKAGFNPEVKKKEQVNTQKELEKEALDITNTKHVVPQQKKDQIIDNRFIKIEYLPSGFIPYDYDQLYARPFSVKELKLIARAIDTSNLDFITQAIDNCINVDVYNLTIPDYFYLYYWFRIESYPNTPFFMQWNCDEPNEETGVLCGHNNTSQLAKSDLKIIHLQDDLKYQGQLPDEFDFPRVKLLEDLSAANVDREKYEKNKDLSKLVDFKFDELILIDTAKWLKAGNSIREKISILESQPDLQLYEKANALNKALQYGVYEYVLVSCMRCGAKRRYRVKLDAPRFFPFIK